MVVADCMGEISELCIVQCFSPGRNESPITRKSIIRLCDAVAPNHVRLPPRSSTLAKSDLYCAVLLRVIACSDYCIGCHSSPFPMSCRIHDCIILRNYKWNMHSSSISDASPGSANFRLVTNEINRDDTVRPCND